MFKYRKIGGSWSAWLATLFTTLSLSPCSAQEENNAWDFTLQTFDDRPLPLRHFAGKVLLIVNTASECGFTKQYRQLQGLWERFGSAGLVIIGIPSDDFGHQEPGSNAQIEKFCQSRFHITFPMSAKTNVRGKSAHPLYLWLAKKTWFRPRWNFHKYLIDRNGQLSASFLSWTPADSPKIAKAIESELSKPAPLLNQKD